jgi:hypothetical protein
MIAPTPKHLFNLGKLSITPAALQSIEDSGQQPAEFLNCHVHGDWGILSEDARLRNDDAVTTGDRIFSTYRTGNGVKIWIITEPADDDGVRPRTTILLPSEH